MKFFTLFAFALFSHSILTAQVYVKQDASGNNDGSSWEDAFTNLQDALDAAAPGDQLWITAGTYIPEGPTPDSSHFWALQEANLYGGFAGTETLLSERDPVVNQTILSGDKNSDDVPGQFTSYRTDNAHHVLIVDAPDGTCVIDGLSFKGGMTRIDAFTPNASDIPYNRWRAGALYIRSSVVLRNCVFRDNYGYQGSGLYALPNSLDDAVSVVNSTFEENNSVGGGTCYISGWNASAVTNCVFMSNATTNFGAGLAIGNSNVTVDGCHFESNQSASEGGAFMLFQNTNSTISDPAIHVEKCTFVNNSSGSRGGAMNFNVFSLGFAVSIDSCTFINNVVASSNGIGGALRIADYTDGGNFDVQVVHIQNSNFENNSAAFGGGVVCLSTDDSLSVNITDVTLKGNTSAAVGGGIYTDMGLNAALNLNFKHLNLIENLAGGSGGGGILFNNAANGRLNIDIDSSLFESNSAEVYAGALEVWGGSGTIHNSTFAQNEGVMSIGAIVLGGSDMSIDGCHFIDNHTEGTLQNFEGGGAGLFWTGGDNIIRDVYVRNSIFEGNTSTSDAGALLIHTNAVVHCENILLHDNQGASTITNRGTLSLLNATLANNDFGVSVRDASQTVFQNTLLQNNSANLIADGTFSLTSNGGNLSSDASAESLLTGSGIYDDLHNLDPQLGPDFFPLTGSPCIDVGNPDGVTSDFDLASNPRIQGKSIDIGCYESFSTAVKDAVWNDPGFSIFPNPVMETLNFELETEWTGEFSLVMYNSLGQQVYQTTMHKSGKQQTFQQKVNLEPGQYILCIPTNELTYAANLLIAK